MRTYKSFTDPQQVGAKYLIAYATIYDEAWEYKEFENQDNAYAYCIAKKREGFMCRLTDTVTNQSRWI